MSIERVIVAATVVLVAVRFFGFAMRGYFRRRRHWSGSSWLTLGGILLTGFALTGFAIVFSLAVDNHEAWVGLAGSSVRSWWLPVAATGLIGGPIVLAGSLLWFANGEPTQQMSLGGIFRGARRALVARYFTREVLPSTRPELERAIVEASEPPRVP